MVPASRVQQEPPLSLQRLSALAQRHVSSFAPDQEIASDVRMTDLTPNSAIRVFTNAAEDFHNSDDSYFHG
jgi:hypothetical protein